MGEELENQQCLKMESSELLSELQLLFTLKPGMDRCRYNPQRIKLLLFLALSMHTRLETPRSCTTMLNTHKP